MSKSPAEMLKEKCDELPAVKAAVDNLQSAYEKSDGINVAKRVLSNALREAHVGSHVADNMVRIKSAELVKQFSQGRPV